MVQSSVINVCRMTIAFVAPRLHSRRFRSSSLKICSPVISNPPFLAGFLAARINFRWGHAVNKKKRVLPSAPMRTKILDTFVRISKGTRSKLNAHCTRNNLQQGRFADSAILAAIGEKPAAPAKSNGVKRTAGK